MLAGSCHCGAVQIELARVPDEFNECQCSICRRYGVRWAYYRPDEVRLAGATEIYMWGDFVIEFHRCKICGCVTHWADVDRSATRMAINGRLLEPEEVAAVPVRRTAGPPEV